MNQWTGPFQLPVASVDTRFKKVRCNVNERARIYISGHEGMVGSAVWKRLRKAGYRNLTGRTKEELDLREQQAVRDFMADEKPDAVIMAAKVLGGILNNKQYPYTILYDNMLIQSNLIEAAYRNKVGKLIYIGNACVYPSKVLQPLREQYLLNGPLNLGDKWYAMAKITGLKLCEAIRKQHKCDYVSLIPSNLYGPNDRFDKAYHFIPDMIRNFHEAKEQGHIPVSIWGDGYNRREFLYVDDLADAVRFFLEHEAEYSLYNVGTGRDLSIRELVTSIQQITGHQGEVMWEMAKPEEVPRIWMDVSQLAEEGWTSRTELTDGLKKTYDWYLNLPSEVRERAH